MFFDEFIYDNFAFLRFYIKQAVIFISITFFFLILDLINETVFVFV